MTNTLLSPPSNSFAKAYVLGLSIGTFWLVAASSGFSITMIASANSRASGYAIGTIAIAATALLLVIARQIVAAARLPRDKRTSEHSGIGRRFLWIVMLEIAGIVLANTIAYSSGHLSLMVPIDLVVIGLHFIPLARLFGVPRYRALGVSFCAIPILTVVAFPADIHIGSTLARFLIPTIGCTVAAWMTSIGNMVEIRRLLSDIRLKSPVQYSR
jgi:hypothetical protein